MATIKFGAIVTDMRGKLGGHVFQKGNQSRVMRTSAKPRIFKSELAAMSQRRVNTVISLYNSLSLANKTAFANIATQFSFKNAFGDSKVYTGRQLFFFLNNNLLRAGLPQISSTTGLNPTVAAPAFGSISFNIATGTSNSVGATAPVGSRYIYSMQRVSRNSVKPNENKFIFNSNQGSTQFNTSAIYTEYVQRFGIPSTSDNIYINVQLVNSSGFISYGTIRKVTFV